MEIKSVQNVLRGNKYPGRGIVVGRSKTGEEMYVAYFIMGRSENSRNRVLVSKDKDVATKASDESKMKDPKLVIYKAVKTMEGKLIISNGDQTDTVNEYIEQGKTFEEAVESRTYEPDAPNYTPRISSIIDFEGKEPEYKISIIKAVQLKNREPLEVKSFYKYGRSIPGVGHLIHTYESDGNPLPTFEGEPRIIEIEDSFEGFTEGIWNSLNAGNKISLFTRRMDLKGAEIESRIINKNTEVN